MKVSEIALTAVGTAIGAAAVTVVGALLIPVVEVAASTVVKAAAVAAVGAAAATAGHLLCSKKVIDVYEETVRSVCND